MKDYRSDYWRAGTLYEIPLLFLGYFAVSTVVMAAAVKNGAAAAGAFYLTAALGLGVAGLLALAISFPRGRFLRVPACVWFYGAMFAATYHFLFGPALRSGNWAALNAAPLVFSAQAFATFWLDLSLASYLDRRGTWDETGRHWTRGTGVLVRVSRATARACARSPSRRTGNSWSREAPTRTRSSGTPRRESPRAPSRAGGIG